MLMIATRCLALSALTLLGVMMPAQAQDPDALFRGKTVTIVIGFGPGGSYDHYARALARHMGRHLPGAPAVVAQNMPGAGSLTAANYLFNVAPKDGSSIGIVSQTMAIEAARKAPGVNYKVDEFNWIGRVTPIVEITLAWHASPVKRIQDAMAYETPISSTGPGSPSEAYPKLMNSIAGTRFRIIGGYPGANDAMLALERGEVDAAGTAWNTLRVAKRDWITDRKVNILVQYALKRSPEMPNIPTLVELGKTDSDRALLSFYVSSAEVGRSFMAPPGLPPARVQVLRRSFDATMADAQFRNELERAHADFGPMTGENLQDLMNQTARVSPLVIERMRNILEAR
jgi:tripartite-type tricarboxylate transporter receptor subunit TctC